MDFGKIEAWCLAKDWRTWISHAVLGFGIAAADHLAGGAWPHALFIGIGFYYVREVGQVVAQAWREGMDAVNAHAADHFFDVAVPLVALALASLVL